MNWNERREKRLVTQPAPSRTQKQFKIECSACVCFHRASEHTTLCACCSVSRDDGGRPSNNQHIFFLLLFSPFAFVVISRLCFVNAAAAAVASHPPHGVSTKSSSSSSSVDKVIWKDFSCRSVHLSFWRRHLSPFSSSDFQYKCLSNETKRKNKTHSVSL